MEIKIRYVLEYKHSSICYYYCILDDVEKYGVQLLADPRNIYKVIARNLFTGKYDRNNQEIYEGDKVRYYTWDGYMGEVEVVFRDGRFYPVAHGCLEYDRFDKERGIEKIGTIYDKR